MNIIQENAKKILIENMNGQQDELLLVVTDDRLKEIASLFADAGEKLNLETVMMQMAARTKSGEEPPKAVAEAMKHADIVLCVTEHSLTHTKARKEASELGVRIATMPGITRNMLREGAITADLKEVEALTSYFCRLLDEGEKVRIEKQNTRLEFSIEGRFGIASTGVFRDKGQSGNLPSGESYIAPLETEANGTILIDGAISSIGVLNEPVVLKIHNGRLIEASGEEGQKLLTILGDGAGRTIAEFGIGTNTKANLSGNVLEDEKVFGTVHIAFGSNKAFGGVTEAGVHIDCVIKDPKVWIDDRQLDFNLNANKNK